MVRTNAYFVGKQRPSRWGVYLRRWPADAHMHFRYARCNASDYSRSCTPIFIQLCQLMATRSLSLFIYVVSKFHHSCLTRINPLSGGLPSIDEDPVLRRNQVENNVAVRCSCHGSTEREIAQCDNGGALRSAHSHKATRCTIQHSLVAGHRDTFV